MLCALVTSSRADFGLLRPLMHRITSSKDLELAVIASGTHLAPHHGMTIREIEAEGFPVAGTVEMVIDSASDCGIAQSMGLGLICMGREYARIRPELVILLGDRYEILAAASAATLMRIPIAHLCGGDVTQGAYDDAFRHSISKMSALHFPSNPESARRLEQIGEPSDRIFMFGSTGLDILQDLEWLSRDEVFARLGLQPRRHNIVVTFHPTTRLPGQSGQQVRALTSALEYFGDDLGIVFTGVNADSEANEVGREIADFVDRRSNALIHKSLGQTLYLNTVRQMNAVVGNSSSGLYEAPSLQVPTVNIGDRQSGRPRAKSVLDVAPDVEAIRNAITLAFSMDCSAVANPYGTGDASRRIVSTLEVHQDRKWLLSKSFVDRF